MQNSNSPPRYGAEGPPGGAEEWNRSRFGQSQGKNIPKLFRQLGEGIRNGPLGDRMRERQQSMTTPKPWSEVPRVHWGGGPPQMPPSGAGAAPQAGMGIMPMDTGQQPQGVQPPSMPQTAAPPQMQGGSAGWASMQPQQQQQTGMAGLGQMARGISNRMGITQPSQSQATQAAGQPQLPQQTGMAGLGQGMGRLAQMARVGALRRGGGGQMQEQ